MLTVAAGSRVAGTVFPLSLFPYGAAWSHLQLTASAVLEPGGQGCSKESFRDASLLRFFDYTCADSTSLQP